MKKFIFAVIVVAAAVFCSGGVGTHYACEYRTHVVKDGETLFQIAEQYASQQDRWDDLRGIVCDIQYANKMTLSSRNDLQPGQRIIIPLNKKAK